MDKATVALLTSRHDRTRKQSDLPVVLLTKEQLHEVLKLSSIDGTLCVLKIAINFLL